MDIRPLTFLQTYRAVRYLKDGHTLTRSPNPFYYHLVTSGYGAFMGGQPVGWMYIKGERQVLTADALAIHPDFANKTIERSLLNFLTEQAQALNRRWTGVRFPSENTDARRAFRAAGYRLWHHYMFERSADVDLPTETPLSLKPLVGPAADKARRQFAHAEIKASLGVEDDDLPAYLTETRQGKHWLLMKADQPVGYANLHQDQLYIATDPAWWGSPDLLGLLGQMGWYHLYMASAAHHDAVRPLLPQFDEVPTASATMFRPVPPKG